MILTLRIAVLAWVASGLAVVACAAGKSKPAKAILPPKLLRAIDKIEAAHSAGDLEGTWRVLAPTVAGLKNDVAARFEEALAERELPGSKDILVDARLKLLTECRPGDLPSPALRERVLILQALPARVLEPLQEVADSPVMDESGAPAKNMEEFDARFKDIRRLSHELQFARLCARYAAELASKLPQTARNKMSDEERDFVTHCEGDLSAEVEKAERAVRELELETRLQRLKYGVEALAEKRLTKEKFVAATSSRRDAVALLEALKSADDAAAASAPAAGVGGTTGGAVASFTSQYTRAALSSADLVTEVERLAAEAKALAGDLADKSERFALGMEAWLRGRHGFGPDIWGLAKSQAALERSNLLRVVLHAE